jgi:D-sedoheptulose 7-phosphate isomerase
MTSEVVPMTRSSQIIKAYLDEMRTTLTKLPLETIEQIVQVLKSARAQKKQVFLFGNGGSAATASHLAVDLTKGTIAPDKPRLRAIALTDNVPLISAWANDTSYEDIFSQQLQNQVEPGDVVIGISGSGRSPNVLKALKLAKSVGATTIGLTGFDGGKMKDLVDLCVMVPGNSIEQVEDVHLMLGHVISSCLRAAG